MPESLFEAKRGNLAHVSLLRDIVSGRASQLFCGLGNYFGMQPLLLVDSFPDRQMVIIFKV